MAGIGSIMGIAKAALQANQNAMEVVSQISRMSIRRDIPANGRSLIQKRPSPSIGLKSGWE